MCMPIVNCRVCKNKFYIKPSQQKLGWGKYCSSECRSKAQFNGGFVECFICSKSVYRSKGQLKKSISEKYFCSKSCQTKWRNGYFIGDKHPNWTGGTSVYRDLLKRNGKEPVCIRCRTNDERVLSVHHLDHNRQNNDVSNLVWICLNCHFLVHHDKDIERKLNMVAVAHQ